MKFLIIAVVLVLTSQNFLKTDTEMETSVSEATNFDLNNDELMKKEFVVSKTNLIPETIENYKTPELIKKAKNMVIIDNTHNVNSLASEVLSTTSSLYYDSTEDTAESKITCEPYTKEPHTCLNHKECGWCNDTNKCIKGNRFGPGKNLCTRDGYMYFAPPNWNPFKKEDPNKGFIADPNITFI
jgi:hypothetical protein